MTATAPPRRFYDHRVRALICRTGDPDLFPELGIPPSTAKSWIRRGPQEVTSLSLLESSELELQAKVLQLRRRVSVLHAVLRLLLAVLSVSRFKLEDERVPEAAHKSRLLRATADARRVLPLHAALRIIGLSPERYHAWNRKEAACELADRSSCPRTTPTQLTPEEVATIRDMVKDKGLRHMPVGTLAAYAQRIGRVFAAAPTWRRLIRERGWRRPRRRIYPEKPKVGVRATRRDEYWHVDMTILKLVDGTKVFIHAVIDNFSRRILAWRVAKRLDPLTTSDILMEAGREAGLADSPTPSVVTDGGIENVDRKVDHLVERGMIRRIVALVEVTYSNSIIEAFWRSMKHQWLYLLGLDSVETVRRQVAFFVHQHNTIMPHSAFGVYTPDEIYLGKNSDLAAELAEAWARARKRRLEVNRSLTCEACRSEASGVPPPSEVESAAA